MSISKGVDQHLEQNVHFNDQTADWVYSVPSQPDATFRVADAQDASLAEFFSRPVRIHTVTWTPGSSVYDYIDPWTLFFTNPRVVNRVNNYNLLRCKLHVKVVLNGNGFYFGRSMVSYLPRPGEISGFPLPRALVSADKVQMSQLPHIYLDPTTSQGGELVLPFFCPDNALSVPLAGWTQMGVLITTDLALLQHANGGTGSITISYFAWAEDVTLSIPTSAPCGAIVPQMGDEYGTTPISKPAFAIARAAGALAKIPSIAPYAKATEMAANATGSIAAIFGYARPTQEEPSRTVKPEFVGVLANTNTPDNATKLTLDCKQEVTVDPRVVGLSDADELSILSLSQRESLLGAFGWSGSSAIDSVLYSKYVTPMSFATASSGLSLEYHLTPCAFAALPFKYWRGTMKFRFQVVASAFHKGRLKIVYDPYLLQSGSVGEYNVNYSHICDLAGERDFTLEIGWGQIKSWLPVTSLPNTLYPSGLPNALLTTPAPNAGANGLFSVIVVNELTTSNNVNPSVQINVFVSTSNDFEVCVPYCDNIASLSWAPGIYSGGSPGIVQKMEPQMGDAADPVDTNTESIPTDMSPVDTLAPNLPIDHTLDVYFGDPVVSFRQCLKRYEFSRTWQPVYDGSGAPLVFRFTNPDIPLYSGAVGGAIDAAVADSGAVVAWNYVKFTLLNYLLPAYAARRGGIRWKYHLTGISNIPASLSVTKASEGVGRGYGTDNGVAWSDGQYFVQAQFNHNENPHTWCATHVTDVLNNPVLEVELPYYLNGRFYACRDSNMTSSGRFSTSYHTLVVHCTVDGGSSNPAIQSYVSVAEDFNLYFFCGVPPIYNILYQPAADVL